MLKLSKELLNQFDAMCNEWFGKNGYSDTSVISDVNNTGRDFHCMDRVGFADWDVCDDVDEQGFIQRVMLDAKDGDDINCLQISLITRNTFSDKAIFWAVFSLVTKYFNVYFMEKHSNMDGDNLLFYFLIKGIVVTK